MQEITDHQNVATTTQYPLHPCLSSGCPYILLELEKVLLFTKIFFSFQ
jgi:hypothetical protein